MKKHILILLALFPLFTYAQSDVTINGIKLPLLGDKIQHDKGREDYLLIRNDSIIYSVVYFSGTDTTNLKVYGMDKWSLAIKDCSKAKEAFVTQYGTGDDEFFQAALFFKSKVIQGWVFREGSKVSKMKLNAMALIFASKQAADNFVGKYFKMD